MTRVVFAVAVLAALGAVGSASGAPANANITSYTATCDGFSTPLEAVRVEQSLDRSANSRPGGVAFHIVGTNQIAILAFTPGLEARSGTDCIVTAVNGVAVDPFPAVVIFV